jgi:nitrogen regulatory protein P-II 2
MDIHARKLLVIIAEAALEKSLVEDVQRLGAQGYTVYDVRGGGRHGERASSWDGDRNIEVKVIATASVAEAISAHVLETYCPHYSVSMFLADVTVLRPEKFT